MFRRERKKRKPEPGKELEPARKRKVDQLRRRLATINQEKGNLPPGVEIR